MYQSIMGYLFIFGFSNIVYIVLNQFTLIA